MPDCLVLTYLNSLDAQPKATLVPHLSPVIHSYIRRMIAKNTDRLRIAPSAIAQTSKIVDGKVVDDPSRAILDRLEQDIYQFHDTGVSMQQLILNLERLALSHQVLSTDPNHPDYGQQLQMIEQDIFQLLGLEVV